MKESLQASTICLYSHLRLVPWSTLVIVLAFWSGVAFGGQMILPLFLGLGQLAWLRHYLRAEASSNTLK